MRTCVEAMAAAFGGTQSLHTNSLDEAIALPTEFSSRIARNTQLIIQEETHITNVIDPWAGSYMMEKLTQDIADEAWRIIEDVDKMGGMTQAVQSGWAKLQIETCAVQKQARIASGQDVIVGVNKYKLKEEAAIDTLDVDNNAVRESQVARLKTIRAGRDGKAVQTALDALTAAAKDKTGNLLDLAIKASRLRATVGEISDALEAVYGRHRATNQTVSGVYSAAFGEDGTMNHRDDIVETLFLNLFHGGRLKAMAPKLASEDGRNVVIRPLAYVPEREIERYARARAFPIIPCRLCGSQDNNQRLAVKRMLEGWEREHPGRVSSIFSALTQVEPAHLADTKLYDFASLTRKPQ